MHLRLFSLFLLETLFLCSCVAVGEQPERGTEVASESQKGRYYTVSAGETLFKIGKKFGVDYKKIAEINGIEPTSPLAVGQKLLIPEEPDRQPVEEVKQPPDKADDSKKTPVEQQPKRSEGVKYVAGEKFIAPVTAAVAVSYGQNADATTARGMEFSCAPGTEVKAARTGVIVTVFERLPGFGRVVIIDHGYGFATFYGYLGKVDVREGAVVKKGEAIGKSGAKPATGKGALHFRIYKNGTPVNPASYIK
jgi:murein DD-endopeptidase MepM/ murein hydrolase activator NlpD